MLPGIPAFQFASLLACPLIFSYPPFRIGLVPSYAFFRLLGSWLSVLVSRLYPCGNASRNLAMLSTELRESKITSESRVIS